MSLTHPQLLELLRELDDASAQAKRLVESHDDRAFAAKPAPTVWSAGEAIAHLTLTGHGMVAAIDRALAADAGAGVGDSCRYRMDGMGRLLRWSLEPPYRVKTPTSPAFVPAGANDRRTVLAAFLEQQAGVAAAIARAQGRDLNRLMVTSPFSARVKYNVYAALRIVTTHERRHLWQAEQALARATRAPIE